MCVPRRNAGVWYNSVFSSFALNDNKIGQLTAEPKKTGCDRCRTRMYKYFILLLVYVRCTWICACVSTYAYAAFTPYAAFVECRKNILRGSTFLALSLSLSSAFNYYSLGKGSVYKLSEHETVDICNIRFSLYNDKFIFLFFSLFWIFSFWDLLRSRKLF